MDRIRPQLLIVLPPLALMALVLLYVAGASDGLPGGAAHVLREPQDVLDGEWYSGSLSTLGGLLWAISATALALVALRPGSHRRTAAVAAGLSIAFALDDVFLIHDYLAPQVGISDKLVFAAYGLVGLWLLLRGRPFFVLHGWIGPLVAGGLLATSVGADYLLQELTGGGERPLLEDGSKLLGATVWATWSVATAARDTP
jgi:hypothetical protein